MDRGLIYKLGSLFTYFCYLLLLIILIEVSSCFIVKSFPAFFAEGIDLNKHAWESSYLERKLLIPKNGPREGYWGERVGPPIKREPYSFYIEPQIKVDNLLEISNEGLQVVGDVNTAEYKILIIGGSVAFGQYAQDIKHTFFSQLHDFIQSRGYPVAIYVLATRGWTSSSEVAAFRYDGLKIKPDLVIFLNGLNDLTVASGFKQRPKPGLLNLRIVKLCSRASRILINSNTFRVIKGLKVYFGSFNIKNYSKTEIKSIQPSIDNIVDTYLTNMEEAKTLAESNNIKVIYILQPCVFMKQNLTFLEKKIMDSYGQQVYYVKLENAIDKIRLALVNLSDNQSTFFCDCSNSLSGQQQTTFTDLWHFSDIGHNLLLDCGKNKILNVLEKIPNRNKKKNKGR